MIIPKTVFIREISITEKIVRIVYIVMDLKTAMNVWIVVILMVCIILKIVVTVIAHIFYSIVLEVPTVLLVMDSEMQNI